MIWGHDPPRTHEKITGKTDSFRAFFVCPFSGYRPERGDMNGIDAREIGQRIKDLRKEKGLTQQELAELVGVSQNLISKIEPGMRVPSVDLFAELSRVFEVSLDYLVLGRR